MVNFPGALDSLTNPGEDSFTDDTGLFLDVVISTLNDIAEALETKLGIGASVPTTVGHVLRVTGAGATIFGYPILSTAKADLAADVALNNIANFFDGPSVSLAAGTWLIVGTVLVTDTAGLAGVIAKLWDGTTVESSDQVTIGGANYNETITLAGVVSPGTTTTYKISCRGFTSASGKILAATPTASQGNNASHMRAIRIG